MINFGGDQQWAKLEHFDVQWFYAYSKYPSGYQIRHYDGMEKILVLSMVASRIDYLGVKMDMLILVGIVGFVKNM